MLNSRNLLDYRSNKGILVDEWLRTNEPDIYAAGDVAEFYQPILGSDYGWNTKTMPMKWENKPAEIWLAPGKI